MLAAVATARNLPYSSSDGVAGADSVVVDAESLTYTPGGLPLASLVSVDVLYFDGSIPTVFLTDSEVSGADPARRPP